MSEKTHRRLILCLLAFCLLITIVLGYFELAFALMWVAIVVLVCLVIKLTKPEIFEMAIQDLKSSIKKPKTPPPSNTLDHVLIRVDSEEEESHLVDNVEYVIGRGADCNLALSGDATVGRKHCRILYRQYSREYYIEDLRSKNGTYLGTRRLEPFKQEKLLDNAEITIGYRRYRFVRSME